jgi:hypothetical protein
MQIFSNEAAPAPTQLVRYDESEQWCFFFIYSLETNFDTVKFQY